MKKSGASFQQLRDSIIEDFGRAYSNFGQSRLKGRIVGLLLASPEPCSLDQICEVLAVSKGPVSTVTRQLREQGLLRKAWTPGDRRSYYEVVPDIFRAASRHNLKLIRENRRIARRSLALIEAAPKDNAERRIEDRLRVMEEFYSLLAASFESFIEDWEREPRGRPQLRPTNP